MTWRWQSPPPERLTLHAGSTVSFQLALESAGAVPSIAWDDARLGALSLTADPEDPRRVQLTCPPDQRGTYRLAYRIEGEPLYVGLVSLEIQPPLADVPPTRSRWTTGSLRHLALQPPLADVPSALPQHFPAPYTVEVWREGNRLPHLTTPLAPHRVVTVGRYSRSQGILPDIDLADQFGDGESESLCSRQQAEVFWQGEQVRLRNLGTNPLQLRRPDGTGEDLPPLHSWLPGQLILLPGGLTLQLVRRDVA